MARIKRPRYVQFTVKTLYELKPVFLQWGRCLITFFSSDALNSLPSSSSRTAFLSVQVQTLELNVGEEAFRAIKGFTRPRESHGFPRRRTTPLRELQAVLLFLFFSIRRVHPHLRSLRASRNTGFKAAVS